jgi:hypothetical protein
MATPVMAFAQIANECEKDGLIPKNAERVGHEIAKVFSVQNDEVAMLMLEKGTLSFVYPTKLTSIGVIPLNTSNSVAARTANTKRAEVINNFAQAKHATVFEAVELSGAARKVIGAKEEKGAQVLIQKLMSVPVVGTAGVLGVIQVCRKGVSAPAAGPDFGPPDLQKLVGLAGALAKCYK